MAHVILKVVTADPQIKHVPEQVCESAMHKGGSDERKKHMYIGRLQSGYFKPFTRNRVHYDLGCRYQVVAGKDLGRNRRIAVGNINITSPFLQPEKDDDIYCNKYIIDDRGYVPVPVIISNRYEHMNVLFFLCKCYSHKKVPHVRDSKTSI